ncbi:STAS domain-containing protein [bacterium]|jgi:anti-sigma B factor antagonist|nr:STAS domain-containing protein [bacterium]
MSVKKKIVDDIAVITVKGKLMGGSETDECHNKVKEFISKGNNRLVINLASVKWLNSRGLGMLMACYTSCKNAGGELKIAGATEKVNSLLMMTKLLTIFETFENVDRAVGSYL